MLTTWIHKSCRGRHVQRFPSRIFYWGFASPKRIHSDANYHKDDYFEYTSGRWLYNESLRLSERRLLFNVKELKCVAATCLGQPESEIEDFSKLAEGGFNRIFQVRMKDGSEVLARLPYPSTKPSQLCTASEVATIDLLRAKGIPAPRILSYSTNAENPIESEFMIMDKLQGRPIGDRWYQLTDKERLKVILGLVKMEAQLFKIDLPAYGSIYYEHDLCPGIKSTSTTLTTERGKLCVGPDVDLRWWHNERESLSIGRSFHATPSELLQCAAKKELAWLKAYGRPRLPFERAYRECMGYQKSFPDGHIESLEAYLKIASYLVPRKSSLHKPTLRHPDLQPNNIFVSEDFDILGIIDWQHCSVLPRFLAAGIPKYFQNYHDEQFLKFRPPQMPENLAEMDDEEQAEQLEKYRRRHLHFFYLGFTQRFNPDHFEVLSRRTDLLTRKIFDHASEPWEGNNIPLKADLIYLAQAWRVVMEENAYDEETMPPNPICFSEPEIRDTLHILHQQEDTDTDLENVRNAIGVSIDGCIANEEYEGAVERAKFLKIQALESLDTEEERELTSKHWPFDDFDEGG